MRGREPTMAHVLLIDDDPALIPEQVRQAFAAPRYRVEVAGTGAEGVREGHAALGTLPAGTDFYRDFAAGTYQFTVQSYGLPTSQADTVQLAPGTQTYLQVQWAPTWEAGYAPGTGDDSHSFFVLTMSPQLAGAYLPSLTYLGQR